MSATIDEDRATVRRLLDEAESHIRNGDADSANAATDEAGRLLDRWSEAGQAAEVLTPLLSPDEPAHVRTDAASYLLHHGHADLAIPVLESVDLVRARVTLNYWRRQQGASR